MDAALDRAGDQTFFGLCEFGIAEGNDDTLTRQKFYIAIELHELHYLRALYRFRPKIHERNE